MAEIASFTRRNLRALFLTRSELLELNVVVGALAGPGAIGGPKLQLPLRCRLQAVPLPGTAERCCLVLCLYSARPADVKTTMGDVD